MVRMLVLMALVLPKERRSAEQVPERAGGPLDNCCEAKNMLGAWLCYQSVLPLSRGDSSQKQKYYTVCHLVLPLCGSVFIPVSHQNAVLPTCDPTRLSQIILYFVVGKLQCFDRHQRFYTSLPHTSL